MSLANHFFRELRPLFRLLEEPHLRPYAAFGQPHRNGFLNTFNSPFFNSQGGTSLPAVDVNEDSKHYIIEAELPGIKRDNIDVSIGDNGRSLTIGGKSFRDSASVPQEAAKAAPINTTEGDATSGTTDDTVAQSQTSSELPTERMFTGSTFSRTIYLPRRVDASNVSAKLLDGILTVRIPKLKDEDNVKINIE